MPGHGQPRRATRQPVGLSDAAIGIEMVGTSDGDILGRPHQLSPARAPTRYLTATYAVSALRI